MNKRCFIGLVGAMLLLAGCRGMVSDDPPVHPNRNMDYAESFEAQEANVFFDEASVMAGAAQRPLVPGTIARGYLREDAAYWYGRNANGAFVQNMPVEITRALLERGQERYNIYCTPCHGYAGDGQGIIMTGEYGYVPAPTYHSTMLREIPDGHLYNVIANGIRNMPAYGYHIPVEDRWAIVAYIRALQRSQDAREGDVPPDILNNIEDISPNVGITGGSN